MLAFVVLRFIHILHSLSILWSSFWKRLSQNPPLPLTATRRRLPKHLAVLFTKDSYIESEAEAERLLDTVDSVISWCRIVGIGQVSFFDCNDTLPLLLPSIQDRLNIPKASFQFHDPEIKYPLTPPSSDYSESRPLSPNKTVEDEQLFIQMYISDNDEKKAPQSSTLKHRHGSSVQRSPPISVYILSSHSSKAFLASTARNLRATHKAGSNKEFHLTVNMLASILETGKRGFPAPDFMIVYPLSPATYHRAPLEIHNYPPWHLKLTEIYLNRYRKRHRWWLYRWLSPQDHSSKLSLPLSEIEFRQALDEFGRAEMRFGK